MAFNYQELKNLKTEALIDDTINSDNIGDGQVHTAKINSGTMTSAKFGSGSVNTSSGTVTGTLPVNRGGTGLTSVGGNNTVLTTNNSGNGLAYANTGLRSMQVFTGGGTWNKPSGVRYIHVQVTGAGGGGSGHGESGGAGGYAEEIINVSNVGSVSVSIGNAGGGTYYANRAGNSNGSSFGNYCSASGGRGANRNNQHSGGLPGIGSGGNLNSYGGGGGSHHQSYGPGGRSFWGGSSASGHPQGGNFAHNHQSHAAYGCGGQGGYFHGIRGANGRNGLVVITEYY